MFISVLAVRAIAAEARTASLSDRARVRMRRSGIVGPEVIAALETQEKVRVIIAFAVPGGLAWQDEQEGNKQTLEARIAAVSRAIIREFAPGEFEVRRRFRSINALAGMISASGVLRLLDKARVVRIDLDAGGSGHLAEAVPLMKLDALHDLGLTGRGVTVAVLDSGYDTDHPDLRDDLVGEQCFCSGGGGCCPNASSSQSGQGSAEDDHGHGTNVSGIITSKGTIAPVGGAPDAAIVAVKVLDRHNTFCCSSDVVAGLDWIINNRPDVDVVNMSLGTFALFPDDCDDATAFTMAFAAAINALKAQGVLVFASSGNNGSGTDMPAPACIASTISVGAVWDSNVGSRTVLGCTDATTQADQVTCFSNSNAQTDLFAPGAPTTSTGRGGGTSTFFGTSQASPAAAACAAVLLEQNPALSPAEIELALKSSPTLVLDATNGLSFPRVDCEQALRTLLAAPCDANGDATVNVRDALAVLRFLRTGDPLLGNGDCNEDGVVNFWDVIAILVLRTAIAPPVWRGGRSLALRTSGGCQLSEYLWRTVLGMRR
jgi:subtilisin family serine protease